MSKMSGFGKTARVLALTINVGSRDTGVRKGGSRGSIDLVVQYHAFHARFDWHFIMMIIIIPSLRRLSAILFQKISHQILAAMKLETCFPLWLKWEDCDNDPSRNKQRTTGVNRG
jgi:hypothetical protein